MITFIADIQNSEPDILTSVKGEKLIIFNDSLEALLEISSPVNGWTQELLLEVNNNEMVKTFLDNGCILEAYVGDQWVGSTEV